MNARNEASLRISTEKLGQAFTGPIEAVQISVLYKLALVIVAVTMIVLPLVYLVFIGLTAYGVYYHTTENIDILSGSGSTRLRAVAYVTPIVVGTILVLFMIKPIFARRPKQARPLTLSRQKEPILFAFVEKICQTVGAPTPRSIHMDAQVNASASFRRGVVSLFGNDLVLTLGLPLVAGLNIRQLAGVLAHEFGHFAQGVGLRFTYIIRSVNMWFHRVVYERDAWDERLAELSEKSDIRIGIILYLARFFVWITRRILWVLMMVGHVISCFMLRQMEYDADRYEARVSGSDVFESTVHQLQFLNVASQGAYSDLGTFWQEGRLADDLQFLIMANLDQIPKEVKRDIEQHMLSQETGFLDTHPSDSDRIRSAHDERAPGIFRFDGNTDELFSDFKELSSQVTLRYYRAMLGTEFTRDNVVPTEKLLEGQEGIQEGNRAAARYFQGTLTPIQPLFLDDDKGGGPIDVSSAIEELKQVRQEMEQALPRAAPAYKRYAEADTNLLASHQAETLLSAKLDIVPEDFNLTESTQAVADSAYKSAVYERRNASSEVHGFETAARSRLALALHLLNAQEIFLKLEDGDNLKQEAVKLQESLGAFHGVMDSLFDLRKDFVATASLFENAQGNEENKVFVAKLKSRAWSVRAGLDKISQALSGVPYPFKHAKKNVSIGDFAVGSLPPEGDLGAIYYAGQEALDKLFGLYYRVVGQLALIAEKVEATVGLPALPEPVEEQPDSTEDRVVE